MAAGVHDVVPHVGDRDEEVRDLLAGWRFGATDDPRVRCVAAGAACRDQHLGLGFDEVGHGEGVPGAAAPPVGRGAHDREAERDSRERVCHDNSIVVEDKVAGRGQAPQPVTDIVGVGVERAGELVGGIRCGCIGTASAT